MSDAQPARGGVVAKQTLSKVIALLRQIATGTGYGYVHIEVRGGQVRTVSIEELHLVPKDVRESAEL